MAIEKSDKEDFGTWFSFDGLSALVKCVLFRSSALNLLDKHELLLATISSYYSLFHFGLALVFFNPEKSDESYDFLVKLRKDREKGSDPQKKITHKKLIVILEEIGFASLSKSLSDGKTIREFYNYGPRLTMDVNNNPYFGNPLGVQEKDKFFPKNCEVFVRGIDGIIYDEFRLHLNNTSDMQLYALLGLWNQTEKYLNDESLHFNNLYSKNTLASAEQYLCYLEIPLNKIAKNHGMSK